MRTRNALWTLSGALALSLMIAACGVEPADEETSVESIQESLELSDTGGFTMEDELPGFGLPDLDELELDAALQIPEPPAEMDTLMGLLPPDPNKLPPPCPHGLLKGHWKPIKAGYGVFRGKWAGAGGKVMGHFKGIYGKNKAGHNVFFGKYISKAGKFVGLLKGRYGKGFFKGRWFDKGGLKGMLRGAYGKAKCVQLPDGSEKCLPGPGKLVGGWVAHCPKCQLSCKPGHVQPPGLCICVPDKVIPCIQGQCPQGMFCDPCPPLPGCLPGTPCASVCAPPICRQLPPQPAATPQSSAGTNVE